MKIGFVGAGNMGGAILKGLIKSQNENDKFYVFDVNEEKVLDFVKLGAVGKATIESLVEECDVIFLGVKPTIFPQILENVKATYNSEKLIISMAAGVKIENISKSLGEEAKIIRIMPNTPALVGQAMISLSNNKNVSEDQVSAIIELLNKVGKAEQVDEELIHCVIGVSGSSPAYTFLYIKALADAAVKNGMDEKQALEFAAQAVLGAAKMVLETDVDPQTLCDNVCSPNGTTIEAVNKLKELEFEKIVGEAFQAAVDRSKEMSK